MRNRRKVLFFLPSNTGGAQRMTVTIAKMLPKERFEVKFVIVHRSLGTIVKFIPEEYEIIHIPVHNIYCAATLRIMRIIRRERPDVVFGSLLYLNARLIVAAKLCGCKSVVRNNIDLSRSTSKVSCLLVKATYHWADKVIAQQEEMHDEIITYTGIQATRVITLHNPIDTDYIDKKASEPSPYGDDETQVKYVWVGRFSPEKGQDLVVKALEKVREAIPNAHLYLVGKYDLSDSYSKLIFDYVATHQLSDAVHCVGFDTNPYRWVKHCDCYVMPSRLEGLPNSLIDAMYLGKPVVATKCIPVVERIVQNGYNGILAESGDVDSIANGMVKALQLKEFAMTYKPASKEDFIKLFE